MQLGDTVARKPENSPAAPYRQKGISLYYQIEEIIRAKIQSGEWEKGMKIPSEPELSAQFEVSRVTIRQAISNLVQKGMLVRKQGSGTYVARPSFESDFLNFSFPDSLGGGHKLLGVLEMPGKSGVTDALGLPAEAMVAEIYRLRYFDDGCPAILEKSYLEQSLYQKIKDEDLCKKIHVILDEQFEFNVTKVRNALEPVLLNEAEAEALRTNPGSPALLVSRIYYTYQDKPLTLIKNLIRADKCKYLVML